ncbi:MAG: hypothetical protein AAEJ04_07745 [Planctomycetota bacterium]
MYKSILIAAAIILLGTPLGAQGGDECASAEVIAVSGFGSYVVAMDNTTATTGLDPIPVIACNVSGQFSDDIWFSFTPDADGSLMADTCDLLGWDTDMVVYDGSGGCGALIEIGCNGDSVASPLCQNFYSQLEIPLLVFGGVTYYFRIGNYGASGTGGAANLNIEFSNVTAEICDDGLDNDADGLTDCFDSVDCPFGTAPCLAPTNDDCVGATDIPVSGPGIYTAFMDSTLASLSVEPLPTIPCPLGSAGTFDQDIWYTLTPDFDAVMSVDTCDPFGWDTHLLIYEGTCGSMIEVGCSGDSDTLAGCQNFYSNVQFLNVSAGITYTFRIGSWAAGVGGTGNLNVSLESSTVEICDDGIDNDIDGLIDCQDVVDCPFGTPPCTLPTNDECSGAIDIPVSGIGTYTVFMDNYLATTSAVPLPTLICPGGASGSFDKDLWYSFTPDIDGIAGVHTCDPNSWDTDLLVYEGDCASLVELACNGDGNSGLPGCQVFYSHVEFLDVTAGTTYTFRIGSWGIGAFGSGELTITLETGSTEICDDGIDNDVDGTVDCQDCDCENDPACAGTYVDGDEIFNAISVGEGANPIDTTTFSDSTHDYNDGNCTGTLLGQMSNDGWYSWIAANTGTYWIHTCDIAGWDTDLVAYEGDCDNLTQIACNGDDAQALVTGCQNFFSFVEIDATAGTEYFFRVGSYVAGVSGTGTLTIEELLCPLLSGLAASTDCASSDVTLTWAGDTYDSIEVLRDSVVVATLPGTDTSFLDSNLANGTYSYDVQGICGGVVGLGQNVVASIAPYGGETDVIFALEGVDDIDSVVGLQQALDFNGITYLTTTEGPDSWGCLGVGTIQRAWMMTGTYPNDYRITDGDGTSLAAAVENGTAIYMEAGDHWGFTHLITAYDNYDGVDQVNVLDGDDSFLVMNGADTGFGLDTSDLSGTPYNQAGAAGGSDWTDQIAPLAGSGGPNVAQLWTEATAGYGTGIYYATDDPSGNTISQSWEFGGFGGDQNDLAARYIAALGGGGNPTGPLFQRGDCNADSGFNIADAIYTLASLFSGGPAGTCSDACDSNDDGGLNIADAIYTLAALFSGGPTPAPPSPGACGEDATGPDALDCVTYNGC